MPLPRKTLGEVSSPSIRSLMRLMETQSKATIGEWCLTYAEEHIFPIYQRHYPDDPRPLHALLTARDWFLGKVKLPVLRRVILQECHAAAREAESNPAAQAAARACGQAAACCHAPSHALGIAFYGTAAIAYDRVGTKESPAVYERIALEETAKMEAALRAISVENEPDPARLHWQNSKSREKPFFQEPGERM